jgi:hypothetical protein
MAARPTTITSPIGAAARGAPKTGRAARASLAATAGAIALDFEGRRRAAKATAKLRARARNAIAGALRHRAPPERGRWRLLSRASRGRSLPGDLGRVRWAICARHAPPQIVAAERALAREGLVERRGEGELVGERRRARAFRRSASGAAYAGVPIDARAGLRDARRRARGRCRSRRSSRRKRREEARSRASRRGARRPRSWAAASARAELASRARPRSGNGSGPALEARAQRLARRRARTRGRGRPRGPRPRRAASTTFGCVQPGPPRAPRCFMPRDEAGRTCLGARARDRRGAP